MKITADFRCGGALLAVSICIVLSLALLECRGDSDTTIIKWRASARAVCRVDGGLRPGFHRNTLAELMLPRQLSELDGCLSTTTSELELHLE
jgi:hypothetical protein